MIGVSLKLSYGPTRCQTKVCCHPLNPNPVFCVMLLRLCRYCLCCPVPRFESRWIQVNIAEDNPSIWLKGMGGSTVGVWAAHGEGQVLFPDAAVQAAVVDGNLAPIRWVLCVELSCGGLTQT